MLNKIKKDLEEMFRLHGINVIFHKSVVVERNALNEPIRFEPMTFEEVVIPSNQLNNFVESLVGDLRSGGISLLLTANTALTEKDSIVLGEISYTLNVIEPVRAFGEILCYRTKAERADTHGRSL